MSTGATLSPDSEESYVGGGGRDESEEERNDRKWEDILQELRVMQTGVQLLGGILLTLPFQNAFSNLDTFQRTTYLALVVVAAVTTALVMTPVALHRRLSGHDVKDRLVHVAHLLALGVLSGVGTLIVLMTVFVFDLVLGRSEGLLAGAVMATLVALLLVAVPALTFRAPLGEETS